ncbi:MAG: SHOCT domain-containing protein [Nocardioidaceae bacterium]|nr:SHOCT domain-containing protein [Nocardioidaceae bacterium]NUS50417.1 SHOCT domain-containing protein [Nocardioidaceae bacterium]
MPGLLRGVARTAVIAGTASAVNGRVQRRQAAKFADRDAHTAAMRQQAYDDEAGYQQAPPPQQAATSSDDRLASLEKLGNLRSQGVLSEEEFAAEKAKILNG